MSNVISQLEQARKDLVDRGLRNPFLNFKVRNSIGFKFQHTDLQSVYDYLVHESGYITFDVVARKLEIKNIPPQHYNPKISNIWYYIILAAVFTTLQQPVSEYVDVLTTPYTDSILQKRLIKTENDALTYLQERGVNILYLAFGFLSWKDSDGTSGKTYQAPLVLVPVSLTRHDINSEYQLKYNGEDIIDNLSLKQRLQNDFRLHIPSLSSDDDAEPQVDLKDYFRKIEQAIGKQSDWSVIQSEIALSTFMFGRLVLFHDLDPSTWRKPEALTQHPIISQLLGQGFSQGFQDHATRVDDLSREQLDGYLSPLNNLHVLDADSSQAQAIKAVSSGRNLVIQGPPGTGKSQTIANLIAEAAGNGKRVLFVAEKNAALDVVKRRLDHCGIGDLCLELHSQNATRSAVVFELKRTFELGRPVDISETGLVEKHRTARQKLQDYSSVLHQMVGTTGITLFQAYGEYFQINRLLGNIKRINFETTPYVSLGLSDYKHRREIVTRLQETVMNHGLPENLLFRYSRKQYTTPHELEEINIASANTRDMLQSYMDEALRVLPLLKIPIPPSIDELNSIEIVLRKIAQVPQSILKEVAWNHSGWKESSVVIVETIKEGVEQTALEESYLSRMISDVLTIDLVSIRLAIHSHKDNLFRFLNRDYGHALKEAKELFKTSPPENTSELLDTLDILLKIKRGREQLATKATLMRSLVGTIWEDTNTDWDHLKRIIQWQETIKKNIDGSTLPSILWDIINIHPPDFKDHAKALNQKWYAFVTAFHDLTKKLLLPNDAIKELKQQPINTTISLLNQWSEHTEDLKKIFPFNMMQDELETSGLQSLYKVASTWEHTSQHLVHIFDYYRFRYIIDQAWNNNKILLSINNQQRQKLLEDFQTSDLSMITMNQQRIVAEHYDRLPRSQIPGQVAILQNEFNKKRRHLQIRKLMEKAGNAVQALKPIFMMSPMSVATYLPPEDVQFDLVVFDEASQIRPADALGAIARGKQIVVVGDQKQLPPTTFFDVDMESDATEDVVGDYESILSLFMARNAPFRMLRWHYRSRHDSLIAVSNKQFYDGRLYIFPTPDHQRDQIGLQYRYLQDTYYEQGTACNIKEAEIVAKAVFEHFDKNPDQTLGVATFNVKQADAIRDALEVLRRENPHYEQFFSSVGDEPFFVKNLENVQGDERDVIFISIGYGHRKDGRLSMNFGPLNKQGGERRLNVLITRARNQCVVFTNLSYQDIDLQASNTQGVIALKRFLQYAEKGEMEMQEASQREPDSPFEEDVAYHLRMKGHIVHHQVGTAGFFIDLAIVHPDHLGRYILGIECDGASYHSAASARERDRLRQQILESKGWIIHRIWSTDWFQNRAQEIDRVDELIKRLHQQQSSNAGKPKVSDQLQTATIQRIDVSEDTSQPPSQLVDYELATLDKQFAWDNIDQVPNDILLIIVKGVIDKESPIHENEVVRRVCRLLGFARAGGKIHKAIKDTMTILLKKDHLTYIRHLESTGSFLFRIGKPIIGRDRHLLTTEFIKFEYISEKEIAVVMKNSVVESYGIEEIDLLSSVCKQLGFSRTSQAMNDRCNTVLNQLIEQNELLRKGSQIIPFK